MGVVSLARLRAFVDGRLMIVGAVSVAGVLALAAGPAAAKRHAHSSKVKYQPVTLKFSDDFTTTGQPLNLEYQQWATHTIENASHGAIKVQFYPAAELYTGATAAPALANGTLSMAAISSPSIVGVIPQYNILSLPYLGPTDNKAIALTEPGTPLFNALAKATAQKGITLLPTGVMIPGDLGIIMQSSTPTGLAGLNGLKIRSVGGSIDDGIISRLGGSPIDMTPTDVPTAMQTGAVNAAFGTLAFESGPLAGIAHGFVNTGPMLATGYYIMASTKVWNKLSTNDRNLIDSTLETMFKKWWPNEYSLTNRNIESQLESGGVWIKQLSKADSTKAQKEMRPIWTNFGKTKGMGTVYKALQASRKKLGLSPTL